MNITSKIYNFWLDNKIYSNSNLYKEIFKNIPKNSKILEVGIGTGVYLTECANIIKEKNISIDGIDINKDYIKSCKNEIKKNNLDKYVKAHIEDLLKYKIDKFDYILFVQTYPVIDNMIMNRMLNYLKNSPSKDAEIIFVHNLVDNKNTFKEYIKPKMKYIIGIDFGKLETHDNFDKFLTQNNMYVIEKKRLVDQDVYGIIKIEEFMIKAKFRR